MENKPLELPSPEELLKEFKKSSMNELSKKYRTTPVKIHTRLRKHPDYERMAKGKKKTSSSIFKRKLQLIATKKYGFKDFPEHKHYNYNTKSPHDYSYWHLDHNLNPEVSLTKEDANKKFSSKEDAHKYFYHPFLGLFPHESDEAITAKHLLLGNHKKIVSRYPHAKKLIAKYPHKIPKYTEDGLKELNQKNKDHSHIELAAGLAHEIIIGHDRKAYYAHLHKHEGI